MRNLTFYRQERADGAIRTGLEYEGTTILEHFEPGTGEPDAALRWYVDIRCEGAALPVTNADQARNWMLAQKDNIAPALENVARELEDTGIDHFLPLRRDIPAPMKRLKVQVIVSGIRRLDAKLIAAKLLEIGQRWEELLHSLTPVSLV